MIVSSPTAPSRGHASLYPSLDALLAAVRGCRACEAHLPLGPRPVLRAGAAARILVVGQAPGVRVHQTGVPWDDPSGERLREWMGVDRHVFMTNRVSRSFPWDTAIQGGATAVISRRAVNVRRYGSTNCWPDCPELN